ncbi:MAG: type II toxin-antitoxin system VapC family toxin [Candidatus Sulfotelmatobacter sp.]
MKRFVLDASVALAWFIDNPTPPLAERIRQALLQGGKAVVPALWHPEMANGLVVAERRGTLSAAGTAQAIEQIGLLLGPTIERAVDVVSIKQALGTARTFQLTAYDAVYLETALRQELPLATLDRQLLTAASKAGVEIVS